MKKYFVLLLIFTVFACVSCNKDEDNPSNPSDTSTYAENEAYCLENGWTERELDITNGDDSFFDPDNFLDLYYYTNGTIVLNREWQYYTTSCAKLYNSFNDLVSVSVPPTSANVQSFVCDNEKFGICKFYSNFGSYNTPEYDVKGYSKFYVRRINSKKIRIFYKKCDWEYVE